MFGYVRPAPARLSEEDKRRFGAAYCGLCRTLGERYGTAARFILNYDFAFLSILLWPEETPEICRRGCIAHPLGGRDYFPGNQALELAADCSVILAWWQLQDALEDPGKGKTKYRAAAGVLKGAYRRARDCRPGFDRAAREQLKRLGELEAARCPSLDEPADTFARLLSGVAGEIKEPVRRRVLEQLLYHLGRWIYLIDAADDLKEDFASGSYNPLLGRFSLEKGELTGEARESLIISLDNSIRLCAAAYELWDFGLWSPVICATVYEGLFLVGKAVLEGTFHAGSTEVSRCRRNKELL